MKNAAALLAALLAGCASNACPQLPPMGADQLLQEYTIEVIRLYNECRGQS